MYPSSWPELLVTTLHVMEHTGKIGSVVWAKFDLRLEALSKKV